MLKQRSEHLPDRSNSWPQTGHVAAARFSRSTPRSERGLLLAFRDMIVVSLLYGMSDSSTATAELPRLFGLRRPAPALVKPCLAMFCYHGVACAGAACGGVCGAVGHGNVTVGAPYPHDTMTTSCSMLMLVFHGRVVMPRLIPAFCAAH